MLKRTTMTSTYSTSKRKSAVSDEERDVDEYNRRYTSVDVEEPYDEDSDGEVLAEYNDDMDNEKTVASDSKKERRSDTEYTERIIRYHSPSKITIAGADQVRFCICVTDIMLMATIRIIPTAVPT